MEKKIKKLDLLSFARFQAVLGGLIGLVAGTVYSFGGLIVDSMVTLGFLVSADTPGLSYGTLLAFGALIGMPLIGLIAGLIVGIVSAVLYNLFAKWFGGVSVDFEE